MPHRLRVNSFLIFGRNYLYWESFRNHLVAIIFQTHFCWLKNFFDNGFTPVIHYYVLFEKQFLISFFAVLIWPRTVCLYVDRDSALIVILYSLTRTKTLLGKVRVQMIHHSASLLELVFESCLKVERHLINYM